MIQLAELGNGVIRALIPDQGRTGKRQIAYAVPLVDGTGRYLVRLPHALAKPAPTRGEAVALLTALAA